MVEIISPKSLNVTVVIEGKSLLSNDYQTAVLVEDFRLNAENLKPKSPYEILKILGLTGPFEP